MEGILKRQEMTEEQMIAKLREKGYTIRIKATGFYVLRYTGKKQWASNKTEVKYSLRRTRGVGPNTKGNIPKDAEIAEIDFSKLDWKPFWEGI